MSYTLLMRVSIYLLHEMTFRKVSKLDKLLFGQYYSVSLSGFLHDIGTHTPLTNHMRSSKIT